MTRNAICCRRRVSFGPGLMAHKTNQLVSALGVGGGRGRGRGRGGRQGASVALSWRSFLSVLRRIFSLCSSRASPCPSGFRHGACATGLPGYQATSTTLSLAWGRSPPNLIFQLTNQETSQDCLKKKLVINNIRFVVVFNTIVCFIA